MPFSGCRQGLIRGEIEAAAQRATAGRGWQSGACGAPGRGECAAAGDVWGLGRQET